MAVLFEEFFGLEGGHAAGAGGGDGLSVAAVLDVAAGEDAGDTGQNVVLGLDVAVIVEVDLAVEHFGVGLVADAEEEAGDGKDGLFAGLDVADVEAGDGFLFDAADFLNDCVGEELDLGIGDGALEHDLAGAEALAAMEDVDLGGEAGEEERFFHGGVAAADDCDLVAGEEEAVAGGAAGDAVADERLLTGQAEPAGAGSGSDDERPGADFALGGLEVERMRIEVDGDEVRHAELGAEASGLLLHVLNEFGALHAVWPAGEVLDQSGDGELSAGLVAFEHERLEVGACGVDGCGESCTTGAKDYCVTNLVRHYRFRFKRYGLHDCRALEYLCTPLESAKDKMIGMANLTLIYGMRLLPEGEVTGVEDATLKLGNGNEAHVTMHVLEGTREQIEAQLRMSIDAFFDFYPEI